MASKWSWHDLFPGDAAITAARRVSAGIAPVTDAEWADLRAALYKRAREYGYGREQLAEMDFPNMARALVRDVERERAAYQGDRK